MRPLLLILSLTIVFASAQLNIPTTKRSGIGLCLCTCREGRKVFEHTICHSIESYGTYQHVCVTTECRPAPFLRKIAKHCCKKSPSTDPDIPEPSYQPTPSRPMPCPPRFHSVLAYSTLSLSSRGTFFNIRYSFTYCASVRRLFNNTPKRFKNKFLAAIRSLSLPFSRKAIEKALTVIAMELNLTNYSFQVEA